MMRVVLLLFPLLMCFFTNVVMADARANRASSRIELHTGEVLDGIITEERDDVIILNHAMFGELEIPRYAIANRSSLNDQSTSPTVDVAEAEPTAQDAATSPASTSSPAPEIETPSHPTEEPAVPWNWTLELGANMRQGNTDVLDGRIVVRTRRDTERAKFGADAIFRTAQTNGEQSEEYFAVGAQASWPFIDSPWSGFLESRVEFDAFESWDTRATASAGVVVQLLDRETLNESNVRQTHVDLRLRVGAGGRREFGSENPDIVPEGLIGAEFAWMISPRQRLGARSTFYPELADQQQYRLVTSLDWTIDLDSLDGMQFKLGMTHEFESVTDEGIDPNDLAAYASLVVDF